MALSDKIWWTKKSRIQAHDRLRRQNEHTQNLLVWWSFASVCIAITTLKIPLSGDVAQVLLVSYSVGILCFSLLIKARRYDERSSKFKECYERLDGLYRKAKRIEDGGAGDILDVDAEYQEVVSISDNHTDLDHRVIMYKMHLAKEKIDKTPTRINMLKVWLYWIGSFLIALLFYALPLILFYFII